MFPRGRCSNVFFCTLGSEGRVTRISTNDQWECTECRKPLTIVPPAKASQRSHMKLVCLCLLGLASTGTFIPNPFFSVTPSDAKVKQDEVKLPPPPAPAPEVVAAAQTIPAMPAAAPAPPPARARHVAPHGSRHARARHERETYAVGSAS
jgi:hypothetical protein